MGSDQQLFQHAMAAILNIAISQNSRAERLNMHICRIIVVNAGQINLVIGKIIRAMVHAMPPNGVGIAETAHIKFMPCWRQRQAASAAQIKSRLRYSACPRNITDRNGLTVGFVYLARQRCDDATSVPRLSSRIVVGMREAGEMVEV